MEDKKLSDLTDKQLADMVRNSIYANNTSFASGPTHSRFLLVMAIPYGPDEDVNSLEEAIEAFLEFMSDDDSSQRDFQVYDHAAPQHFFSATLQEVQDNAFEEVE